MAKRDDILAAAEALFYREGFHATGIDRVIAEAGVTPRTLYRHFRSKDELVQAAIERREARWFARLERERTDGSAGQLLELFDALGEWLERDGNRGCMFQKALGEYGERSEAIAAFASGHKHRMLELVRRRTAEAGLDSCGGLPEQLMLLLEGALALAPVLGGATAVGEARAAARTLMAQCGGDRSCH